ncbi:MAG: helix-turn-helix transcriptional regulator [Leptonema illini]|uniref:Helix-turn-helix transcriptional regulator n=1 Tax=Leptonema illini TaxID=183 RepID=A0A833H3I9_9LEPT|nr:MAG: helix-turn-helix transcriptional regulator [Leptonema illini]
MNDALQIHWLSSGGIFSCIWGLQIIVSRAGRDRALAAALVVAGIWLLSGAYVFSGAAARWPLLFLWHLPIVYTGGPLMLLHYRRLFGPARLSRYHWILPALAVAVPVIFHRLSDAEQREFFERGIQADDFVHLIVAAGNVGTKLSFLVYLLYIGWHVYRSTGNHRALLASGLFPVFFVYVLLFVDLLIGLVGFLIPSFLMIRISALLLPVNLFVFFVLSGRYPNAVQGLQEEMERRRRRRAKLGDLDLNAMALELDERMREEKIYADEDLTLASLARELATTVDRLSYLLNVHMQQSFSDYVNRWRVQEACRLLEDEPERTILSIGFAAGFNSRSSFHRAFLKETGLTPKEYRRRKSL